MPRKILIVDESASERAALCRLLGGEYDGIQAESAAEALDALRKDDLFISAAVIDFTSPASGGRETLRAMRAEAAWAGIPAIVALPAREDARLEALLLGASGFFEKPCYALLTPMLANAIRLCEAASAASEQLTDKLTGIYNREAFFEAAEKLIRPRAPGHYTMSCFDIDNFKVVNDQYGIDKGDLVLRHVADSLNQCVSAIGGICCRVMADKFAVLYPSSYKDSELILACHREATAPNCVKRRIRIRVGRYSVDDLSLSVSAMYDRAAMAEESIRGRYDVYIAQYDEDMRDQLLKEQKIINEMHEALKSGQFEPWFQPQYNHATGAMVGAEALIRWRQPKDGLLTPGGFIPVFERNGFIYELDKYVWEQACAVLRRLLDEKQSPLPISVNISRYDVFRDDFFDVITGLVHKYRIPIDLLWLEITESAFAESTLQIVDAFKKLIDFGFIVEIDDFGSGYSTLNTLKDVPAAVLKLDMKFLENSGDARRGGNILGSIVRMAKWLGMSVIAEGVETREQANYLKSIGCNYVQGFLYAQPMPLDEYMALASASDKERKMAGLETVRALDNNAFWDPKSMETLIFNSYVGGACIFEYHKESMELLRVNDRYAEEIGVDSLDGKPFSTLNPMHYLDAENREIMLANLKNAIETDRESACEIFWNYDMDGQKMPKFFRSTVRVIAKAGDRYLFYCVIHNITEQRLAERKERSMYERLQAIMRYTDCGITAIALHEDGGFDCVFMNGRYYSLLGYTKEQFSKEVPDAFSLLAPEDYALFMPRVRALCQVGQTEAFELRAVRRDGRCIWLRVVITVINLTDIDQPLQLSCFTDITAVKERDEQLQYLNETMLNLMNRTPGGFVQMRLKKDGAISAEYCNDGFTELIGMSRENARAVYAQNVLSGVHPDDIDVVKKIAAKMMTLGEAHNVRCRLRHGEKGYIWAMVSGQMTRDKNGEIIMNAYFTDATEQANAEDRQREILDNLPCGAALYEKNGDSHTVVHINRRFQALVHREEEDYTAESYLDIVHPGDRPTLLYEIDAILRQARDAAFDIRMRGSDGEYRLFHVACRAKVESDERYTVYFSVAPAPGAGNSYQKTLSVALSTIMECTTDMSFAKDKDLRYICASLAFAKMAGLSRADDVVGKTDYDLFEKTLADKYRADDEALLETGKPIVDQVEALPAANGAPRFANTSKYLLRDPDGNLIGLYGLGRDITETRAMKSRLERITNNVPCAIAVYEALPNAPESLRLTYFSDGLCRLFGQTREEYRLLSGENALCLIAPEDLPSVKERIGKAIRSGEAADCVFRVRADGREKWINLKAVPGEPSGEGVTVNAALFDVTQRQEALERLRISEEESRLAIRHSACIICRYTVADRTAALLPEVAKAFSIPEKVYDVPYGPVREGLIAPESSEGYIQMYEAILRGSESGSAVYKERFGDGWRWMKASYSTIFAKTGEPLSAVVSYFDVTDEQEKEVVYKKWQQSLREKPPESYTLFRCNLSRDAVYDAVEGTLLRVEFLNSVRNFNQRTQDYARARVFEEDRARYVAFMNSDAMLGQYYRGHRSDALEYREFLPDGNVRWLRLTVDLVEYPNSTDVEAYLMYEDINETKKIELHTREMAETDPLTGVLNRKTFFERVNRLIQAGKPDARHAFFMLDMDGFKLLNDAFGHAAGDEALIEMARALETAKRRGDLLGRLGGDEFMMFLRDISDDESLSKRAQNLCAMLRKTYSADVRVSVSVGIAVYPRDGENCKALYESADAALYAAKGGGRNTHRFFRADGQAEERIEPRVHMPAQKRRMLIAEGKQKDRDALEALFSRDFIIEKAYDVPSALARLRHYGSAISVALLDLRLPGAGGLEVIGKLRGDAPTRGVPVIALGDGDDREASLRAIRAGASDFICRPVDPDVIRLRVESAVSRAENERLRAQNSHLQLRSGETARYQIALHGLGGYAVELDWIKGTFSYDPGISKLLKGNFDGRSFWRILLLDMTADSAQVQKMQECLHRLADDRARTRDSMILTLRTPENDTHRFRMNVAKVANPYALTEKLILTFVDLDAGCDPGETHG